MHNIQNHQLWNPKVVFEKHIWHILHDIFQRHKKQFQINDTQYNIQYPLYPAQNSTDYDRFGGIWAPSH